MHYLLVQKRTGKEAMSDRGNYFLINTAMITAPDKIGQNKNMHIEGVFLWKVVLLREERYIII